MILILPVFFIGINKEDGAIMNGNSIKLIEFTPKILVDIYNLII